MQPIATMLKLFDIFPTLGFSLPLLWVLTMFIGTIFAAGIPCSCPRENLILKLIS